jgi:hypothetical protein
LQACGQFIFTHGGRDSSKCFERNKSYAAFGRVTHRFLTIQKRDAAKNSHKTNLIILANILAKTKNVEVKFCRLEDGSYLHMMGRFHRGISGRTKVVPLLGGPPTVF